MKFNSYFIILLGLIIIVLSKEPKKTKVTTEIIITTTPDDEEEEAIEEGEEGGDGKVIHRKNGTESDNKKDKEKTDKKEQKEKTDKKKESEKAKQEEERRKKKEEEERKKKEEEERKKKEEEEEEEERRKKEEEERRKKEEEEEEERRRKEEEEKDIRKKVISPDRMLILNAPYQDNEDFIISPLGLGTPVNFLPLQIDTTTYKTWVASVLNKESPSTFSYDKKESETSEEKGEWDTVVDEEGAISGNVIYDKANLGKFQINRFKFIEAVEYEDNFKDFKNGKMGLGNCHYADRDGLDYCLLQKLKDNGSIERRIFSMREFSDTHGEIVIGDITSTSKENDYPLLSVISQDEYDDIEDDEFKMSWITKVSHVLFRDNQNDNLNKIFNNNIYIKDGLASFDSSSHYIEAPYAYIDEFEEKMFNKYYPNICRKVNSGGAYMFLCDKEKYDDIKDDNKDLTFVIVMDGNGFEIPMNLLFEQTRENDYEFFVHFKDYEQNIWNLGHPFFHQFTIIFDQDNQEIGVDGKNVYDLKDQTESALKKVGKISKWWKIILYVILGLLVLAGIFYLLRKWGIKQKLDNGVSPSLVDNESVDDLSFAPGQNVQG